MLIKLKIENIALIEIIEINFEKGLNIITGDSGSGKSLILDSLNALFGGTNIPLKHLIRPGKDHCAIEAKFSSSFQINNWLISNGFKSSSSVLTIKRISYRKNNKVIVGYGAPAKATTALNFFGISKEIDFIVEDNKLKHNKFIPGVKIPIKNGFCQLSKKAKKVATEIEHIIPPIKPSRVLLGDIGERAFFPNDFPIK